MLTKEKIKELKNDGNGAIGQLVREHKKSNGYVLNILENLGQLPVNFDGSFLPELLDSKSSQVRFWSVKNLGKLTDDDFLKTLKKVALTDTDTNVRREAVSSIGRMRNPKAKNILIEILQDTDPKVVCQAIRGLLVFKGEEKIDNSLKPLINHENEMVRTVIYKEFLATQKTLSNQPHTESYEYLKNVVVNGDTIETMKMLKDESVHLTFTSPPYYNARDYSIYPSYKRYLEFLAEVFKQVHRITKEGRFLILNTSPIIIPRISRSHSSKRYPIPFDIHPYLMEMGWEFIDDIVWMKPEASVKNRVGGFMQHRKPLGYKPNSITEYLMVYRKSTEKLLDWNIKQYDWKTVKESKVPDGYETNNVWKIGPCFDKIHSAVFPVELCKRVIQYYSFKGDLVFDPFGGSGTVGKTAKSLDRYFFLTEKDEKYFGYMKSKKTNGIFDEHPTQFLSLKDFQRTII
ncbi:MAG: DNA methyltransferase [Melioribacteraceae bacterium]